MSSNDVRQAVDAAVQAAFMKMRQQLVDSVLASLPEPAPPAPAPAAPSSGGGLDAAMLRGDLFAMMDGSGQVEILNSLMGSITKYWQRSILFLVKGGVFQPWDARGFEGSVGNEVAKSLAIPADKDTILSAALSGDGAQSDNGLFDRLGAAKGARAAVPLGIRSKAAAILFCEGPLSDQANAVAAMEVLARTTAASIELGMLQKRTPPFVRTDAVIGRTGVAAPPVTAFAVQAEPEIEMEVEVEEEPAPAASSWAAPPAVPAAPPASAWPSDVPVATPPPAPATPTPAPVAASWPSAAPASAPPPAPAPAAAPAPPPVQPAAVAGPAAVAEPAAAAATAAADEPSSGTLDPRELLKGGAKPVVDAGQSLGGAKVSSRWKPVREQMKTGEAVDPAMASIPEADRGKHVEAKKIARLLVTEIKLYNEAKVAVGRKNRDLYERLKDDIERSRTTYLQRIDPEVANQSNYFQDELVAQLAEGDAAAMGK